MSEDEFLIGRMYTENGGEEMPVNIDAYLNKGGLVTLALGDDKWIEMSPIMAKKLMLRLQYATGSSLTEMLTTVE